MLAPVSTVAHDGGGARGVAAAVADNPLWYHTIDLGNGVVTPGWFDLRPIVDRMPWPDVRGKRCLDVGTYDGFLAFELERRGAAEVIAADIDDHTQWDWPPAIRAQGAEVLAAIAGPEKGVGFRIAKEALGSAVERRAISVYDLDPAVHGTFDVVVQGSLLLHLRDPLRALEAIRGVCGGVFLSADEIDVRLTLRERGRPVFRLSGDRSQWWLPNLAGYRHMIELAGFQIEKAPRPYAIPWGEAHPWQTAIRRQPGKALSQQLVCRGLGVPHAAVLARPAV